MMEIALETKEPFWSQSPQAGQFNSYSRENSQPKQELPRVSIPSSGSIQFLHILKCLFPREINYIGLNPLKRVNSILTFKGVNNEELVSKVESQSPQAGQFNSYQIEFNQIVIIKIKECLNPLKRVNSILTRLLSFFKK